MQSEKKSVQILSSLLKAYSIQDVVFSPGSRNAPLVIQFCNDTSFKTISVPDERCASFIGLGMAQWQNKPTVICCTSGTASLNYASAIAEAYYQGIPLIVITADRPEEWIDHGEGQSIRQKNIFSNYIKGSYSLPQNTIDVQQAWFVNRQVNEAINLATNGKCGPVHINIPFSEPLYTTVSDAEVPQRKLVQIKSTPNINLTDWDQIKSQWNSVQRKMVLCGQMAHQNKRHASLEQLAQRTDVAVLTESLANLHSKEFNNNIDRSLALISEDKINDYLPDILITVGNAVVSKKIKHFFRTNPPKAHWHIDENNSFQDMFQSLTAVVPCLAADFFDQMCNQPAQLESNFRSNWQGLMHASRIKHDDFLESAAFSDLKAYQIVLDTIPEGTVIHSANSTAIRYIQLFPTILNSTHYCNRGTSGIDGSTSTAIGSLLSSGKPTVLLTGDMSFFYDSNAFWGINKLDNFKVVIFNNSGGGIFRIIEGPDQTNQLESHFETRHQLNARPIAELYRLNYYKASSIEELEEQLLQFFDPNNTECGILEIATDSKINPEELKKYFTHLKS